VARGKGLVPEEVSIAIVCRDMGWDYETYLNQPKWLIDTLRIMKSAEHTEQKLNEKLNG